MSVALFTIWSTLDKSRYFLVPDDRALPPGEMRIRTAGHKRSVDPESLVPFEVSVEQARTWAVQQFGVFLDDLRAGIDSKISAGRRRLEAIERTCPDDEASMTSDAPAALLELLTKLPGAVGQGLSGDENRVRDARARMGKLEQRLKYAGIDVGDALSKFLDRLGGLRREFEKKKDGGKGR